jgi:hypothetical protein
MPWSSWGFSKYAKNADMLGSYILPSPDDKILNTFIIYTPLRRMAMYHCAAAALAFFRRVKPAPVGIGLSYQV